MLYACASANFNRRGVELLSSRSGVSRQCGHQRSRHEFAEPGRIAQRVLWTGQDSLHGLGRGKRRARPPCSYRAFVRRRSYLDEVAAFARWREWDCRVHVGGCRRGRSRWRCLLLHTGERRPGAIELHVVHDVGGIVQCGRGSADLGYLNCRIECPYRRPLFEPVLWCCAAIFRRFH